MPSRLFAFLQPIAVGKATINMPIGVDFLGATDDGETATIYYLQRDDAETLTKDRILEMVQPYTVIPEEGRSVIDFLSNGWVLFENTEGTLPDSRIT